MASVADDGKGRRRVQFCHPDGRRGAIRLGKVSKRNADGFARRVEQLLECMRLKQPLDAELTTWATGLDSRLAAKLAGYGLIPPRQPRHAMDLATFTRAYIDGRKDVKPASKEVWRQGEVGLCDYFGGSTDISAITGGMAENYRQHLIQSGLATATIKKRLDFARQVLRSAVKHRLIPSNPYDDVRIKVHLPDKHFFLPLEDMLRLIDACPSEDWRIIVALGRLAGLRCPSEVLSLRWCDINWQEGIMTVTSPKTAHHPGKGSRFVPIFGRLRPHLERAFEFAPDGAVYVVNESFRKRALGPSGWRNVNLRTQFLRIIARAGLKPWPRLFHNLRSSRETELMANRDYGLSDVCKWMGHSMRVAEKHYLQLRTEAIRAAVAEGAPEAAQNPAQQPRATSGTGRRYEQVDQPQGHGFSTPRERSRNPAKPKNGEGGIRTRGPAFDRTRL
jgi:integrase